MKKKTIKYIRNLYRLKKELNYNAIKDINLFRLGNETKTIKDGDIKNLFEHEEEEEEEN